MSLNQNFTVKNGLNTLGNILSSGTNLTNIFLLSGTAAVNVANAITFNTTGGASSGITYDGSVARTIDYSTVGASPLAGSSSLTTVGTIGSGTWNGNTIGIGYGGTGQTTQQAALNALAGAVTDKYYLKGNGTNVSMAAIASADLPATIASNTTGSAATLTTSRNIWGQSFNGSADVTGNLSNVGNITGTAGITISTASNGNITLSPNGTGIVTTAANFQAASGNFTGNLNVGQNINIAGNLYFGGSAIQLVQGELVINAPIVYLGEDNPTDSLDIGLVGHYVSGSYAHTGLLRSNSTKNWYLFSSMVTEPSANSVSSNTKTIDTLVANTSGSHTGNSSTATKLATQRNITSSGDITFTSTSFDGSADITIPTAIGTNKVQYSQIQQVAANSVLGNPTGSTANVQVIGVSTTGFAVLTATSAANGANAVGLGTGNSVTFKDVTVSNGTQITNSNIFYYTGSSNPSTAITTFNNTTYKTAKYVFRINKSTGASASGEILVNYNTGNTTWEGTVYSILDSSNIFTNVDVTATGSTIDLTFNFNGTGTYTVTIIGDAF